jgi:hypothetical protein
MINIGLSFNYSKFYQKNQDTVEKWGNLWYNMDTKTNIRGCRHGTRKQKGVVGLGIS